MGGGLMMHGLGIRIILPVALTLMPLFCSTAFADQNDALVEACHKGDLKQVQDLLAKGADVNAKHKSDEMTFVAGETAFIAAVYSNHLETVNLLLDNGADINATGKGGKTGIWLAASWGRQRMAELLRQRGAILTLEVAAMLGDTEKVRGFLKKGIDGQDIGTALAGASRHGHLQVIKLLLAKGADVNAKGQYERTALSEASGSGHLEIVKLLLVKGADVNAKDDSGWTALMFAAMDGNVEIVQALLDKGPDINHVGGMHCTTALDWAESDEVVKLLRAHGAKGSPIHDCP
jgi:ankyrin repeat protein